MIRIHNSETNEIIDREMTVSEYKIYQSDQEIWSNQQAEAEAKAEQRQLILDKLGLTADEARLLLG